jgi:hypothetical protein
VVEVERPVRVVETVEVPGLPRGPEWAAAIAELARQLDTGRIYDRDLAVVTAAVTELNTALNRRLAHRRR